MIVLRQGNKILGRWADEAGAVSAALAHSMGTGAAVKIVHEDGAWSRTARLPTGRWVHLPELTEPKGTSDA